MPVRKAVTRSGRHFRVKFPSRKLGKTVGVESLLERDAVLVLEYSQDVRYYEGQPRRVVYYSAKGKPHSYIPDFDAHYVDETTTDIEVKPSAKLLNPKLKEKYELIAERYRQLGLRFEIWTENEIRAEPRFSNIRDIHRARPRFVTDQEEAALAALPDDRALTLKEASRLLGGRLAVLRAVARGRLHIHLDRAFDEEALVWLAHFEGGAK